MPSSELKHLQSKEYRKNIIHIVSPLSVVVLGRHIDGHYCYMYNHFVKIVVVCSVIFVVIEHMINFRHCQFDCFFFNTGLNHNINT